MFGERRQWDFDVRAVLIHLGQTTSMTCPVCHSGEIELNPVVHEIPVIGHHDHPISPACYIAVYCEECQHSWLLRAWDEWLHCTTVIEAGDP